MKRRSFLKGSMLAASGVIFNPSLAFSSRKMNGWVNGFKDNEGRFGVAHIDQQLKTTTLFYTPVRLHGISVNPTGTQIVAPARRPGTELFIFDIKKQETLVIPAPDGRHFFGHSVFSKDGDTLFVTESDYDKEKGLIGVYDANQGYKRVTEFDCGGIGPHELRLSPDGTQLIISNGGILTHPKMGRAKLNLDSMAPNLTYIDIASQKIVQQLSLPEELFQLSIRHMDVDEDGTVYVGLQDQQKGRKDVPLVWQSDEQSLTPLPEPTDGWKLFNGYIGSVSANQGSLCVSSPRGNCVHIWTEDTQRTLQEQDVCGVSKTANRGFLLTTGQGVIQDSSGNHGKAELRFDNHCSII